MCATMAMQKDGGGNVCAPMCVRLHIPVRAKRKGDTLCDRLWAAAGGVGGGDPSMPPARREREGSENCDESVPRFLPVSSPPPPPPPPAAAKGRREERKSKLQRRYIESGKEGVFPNSET